MTNYTVARLGEIQFDYDPTVLENSYANVEFITPEDQSIELMIPADQIPTVASAMLDAYRKLFGERPQ